MFYSGGARKKNAIREILKMSPKPEPEPEPEPESDDDTKIYSESPSSSSSSSDSESETNDDTHFATTPIVVSGDTDADADADDSDEPDIYITTLGTSATDTHHHHYTFIEKELDYDIEEFTETHPDIKEFKLVIYQLNTSASNVFLEFLLYYDEHDKNKTCQFPYYHHHAKQHIRKETDDIMKKLFTRTHRYKGFFHRVEDDKCFIFYEVRYVKEAPRLLRLHGHGHGHVDHWHWVTTPEIIYHQKYVIFPIDETVIELFHIYPTIGVLQSIHGKTRKVTNIELPTILYYGSDIYYAENSAIYGLKREPIISRYGPFYYFTTLEHSFYWACYHYPQHKNNIATTREIRKTANGAISRYAIFTKRMKTVFIDDEYDKNAVQKYNDRKIVFETKMNDYRHNSEVYTPGDYDSVYSYGYDWVEQYDTIYNGVYRMKKSLFPVWCVHDHHQFVLLSYYEIDTSNDTSLPKKYDDTFTGYTIV